MAPRGRGWRLTPVLIVAAVALVAGACGGRSSTASLDTTTAAATGVPPTAASTAPATPSTVAPTTAVPATTAAPITTTTDPPTTVATTRAPAPPYPVTETTLPLVDSSRPTVAEGRTIAPTRALTTLVWAPAVPGRWPLVVFAHGFEVGPTPYLGLLAHWASEGYVVAAPEFPLTDHAVAGANLDENDINNQPADVRFVTDWLVAGGSPFSARIDRSRVAITGHSDGAETALAASVAPVPPGEPAYGAVIVMSGQPVTAGRTANPPILVTQGDTDTINPPSYSSAVYAAAQSPKYLEVLHGAGHLPPEEAGSAWYPTLAGVTVAFLNRYVAGDGTSAALAAAGATSRGSLQSG